MATGQIVTHHVISNADPRDARNTIEHDHSVIARAIVNGYKTKARADGRAPSGDHGPSTRDPLETQMEDYIGWH